MWKFYDQNSDRWLWWDGSEAKGLKKTFLYLCFALSIPFIVPFTILNAFYELIKIFFKR